MAAAFLFEKIGARRSDFRCECLLAAVAKGVMAAARKMRAPPCAGVAFVSAMACVPAVAADEPRLPVVPGVAAQPLAVHARQIVETLEFTGCPRGKEKRTRLDEALQATDEAAVVAGVQAVLDPLCLLGVNINPESRVKVAPGPARPRLLEQGWSQFLVKVHNEAGVTAKLQVSSPQSGAVYAQQYPEPREKFAPAEIRDRWCDVRMFDGRPLRETLSGLELEYRVIQIYSRDVGKRAAVISFDVGQGTQDVGFRSETSVVFDAARAVPVTFEIIDHDGSPATAGLTIRDVHGTCIPRSRSGSPPTFSSIRRFTGKAAKRCRCRPATTRSNIPAGPNTWSAGRLSASARTPKPC